MIRERILLAALALASVHTHADSDAMSDVRLNGAEQARLGVRAVPASAATVLTLPDQPGTVRVPNEGLRVVTVPAEGVLVRIPVAEGQRVEAGTVLAELVGPAVADLEAHYRDAWLARAAAEAEFTRVSSLVADGVLARRALETARLDASRAAGELEAARAALAETGTDEARLAALQEGAAPASRLVLRARAAGTVLRQLARPGERLPTAAPLLEIGRLERLWVEAHVPLDRVRGFTPGSRAWVNATAGIRVEGRVLDVGRRVHEADRGLLVRVLVEDPEAQLIPGQPVEVDLERPAPDGALSVPRSALVMLGSQPTLFVLAGEGWRATPVTVLAESRERLVVAGSLDPGAMVATEGTSTLKALHDAGPD